MLGEGLLPRVDNTLYKCYVYVLLVSRYSELTISCERLLAT
jgi:hypothetical protein